MRKLFASLATIAMLLCVCARVQANCIIPRDATWTMLTQGDDNSSARIQLGFTFNLYGTAYTSAFINNNGNITFDTSFLSFSPAGFPLAGTPMVAGFWADVDTRAAACGRVYYKVEATRLLVTWENVGHYNQDCSLQNTFQIVIGTTSDPVIGLGQNVLFNYGTMKWFQGTAAPGAATVGINKGSGSSYIQVGRFGTLDSTYDGGGGNIDGVYYLNNKCFAFNVSNDGNIPPSFSGLPAGNTINLTCGQTSNYVIHGIGPEINQNVSTVVSTTSPCGVLDTITNGSVSDIHLSVTGSACNLGTSTITLIATDDGTPTAADTVVLTVNVTAPAAVVTAGGPLTFCEGGNVVLTSSTASSYQWANNGTDIPGATMPTYSATTSGSYTVTTVSSAGGCTTTSAATNVTVNPQPQGSLSANGPLCGSSSAGQLTFTATSGTGPFTVVYNDGTANRTATNVVSGTSFAPFTSPVASTTTYTLVSVADANCTRTAGFTGGSATITINPVPDVMAAPSTQTICNSAAITTIALSGTLSGTNYTWTTNNNTNVTGSANAGGTGNSISGSLTNATNTQQRVVYTISPSTANCTGAAINDTVYVNPTPNVAQPGSQTVCSNTSTAAVAFTGLVSGATYSWTNNAPSIGLAASGTGNIPSFTATNATAAPVTATIIVTPTVGGTPACTGPSKTFTITVNSTPTVYNVTGGGSYCSGGTGVAVGLSNSQSGVNYQLLLNGSNTGSPVAGTGAAFSFPAQTATGTYTVLATQTAAGNCTAAMTGSASVTVYPLPSISVTNTVDPSCFGLSNGSISTTATGGTPGYSYAWTPAGPNSPNRTGLAAGSYSVIVTDVHNCTATTTAILSQPAVLAGGAITGTFAVPSCPAYNIYLGYGAASDTMTTAASGGTGPYTYSWSPAVGTSILTSKRVVAPTATTTYTATIADAHGCIATAAYQVKVLNVHCGPAYIGRELNNTVNVCHSYQASPSNLCVSPSAVPGHLAHGDCLAPCGTASRGVGDGDGGGNENDYSGPATITVYPNPAQSTINVGLKGMGNVWKAYQIVDLSGRLVAHRELDETASQDVLSIDISRMVPGLYLIKVNGMSQTAISRFEVQ